MKKKLEICQVLLEANQKKIVLSCKILQIFHYNINEVFGQWVLFLNYLKPRYYI